MKKQVLGFNTWGNNGIHQRTTVGVGLGKLRNTTGSTTRVYNYCSQTSANPLACALGIKPQASVPSAPIITLITSGNEELSVQFTSPTNTGGSPITDYEYSIDNGITFTSSGTIISPLIITGLTNGTTYTIVIRAVNSQGKGENSNSLSGTPSTVPDAPVLTTVIEGNQTLTVNFTQGSDGGSAITNYQYRFLDISGSSYYDFSPSLTASPAIFTGLTNGHTSYIALKAKNANGTSIPSNTISGTPSTIPDPPTSLSATPGNSQATITFTAGSDGGSSITDYLYSTDGTTYNSTGDSSSPITITGLTNGVTYNITLKAVNINGNSSASSPITVTPNITPTIETFTTVGSTSWVVPAGVTSVEYLVVGGGAGSGGGFDTGGGGGGGGGMVLSGTLSVGAGQIYSIVVGDGGIAGVSIRSPVSETNGGNGENSEFGPILSYGGGGGYASRNNSGVSSGGGTAVSGSSTASTGGSGGGSAGDSNGAGGGGGGNSTNGSAGVANVGGNGGAGVSSSITGVSVTYGAGGRGSNGNQNYNAIAGAANTGNGAQGGGATSSSQRNGAAGGSRIVVLKYFS